MNGRREPGARDTRFECCHLCGGRILGHLPICAKCYKPYLVGGKPPEWLRFLVNDLKREYYSNRREDEQTVELDASLYDMEDED